MPEARTVKLVQLDKDTRVLVEIDPTALSGMDVVADNLPKDIVRMINEIGAAAQAAARTLNPDKLSMEFGLEAGGEAGIPFVTKGTATASFKVAVEWTKNVG